MSAFERTLIASHIVFPFHTRPPFLPSFLALYFLEELGQEYVHAAGIAAARRCSDVLVFIRNITMVCADRPR